MVVFNAHNHAFADEVQNAVIQLQVLEDDAYQDVVTPMVKQVQREDACGTCLQISDFYKLPDVKDVSHSRRKCL